MAQTTFLHVNLVDPQKKPFRADRIAFKSGTATQSGKGSAAAFKVDTAGKATLEISGKGHHTYRFDLTVTDAKKDFTVGIDKKAMVDEPKMATLLKLNATGPGPGRNQITLIIGKPREVLLVTGFDYPSSHGPGGMQFHELGTRRMHELRKTKSLDDSTVITWFDCKSGLRTRWVTGKGSETRGNPTSMWASGWCRMSVDGTKPATLNPKTTGYPGPGVNGIPEVMEHIVSVGRNRPRSLEEFSFLGHAWYGGPILFNTSERPEFDSGTKRAERDPQDRDGRFWKDFNSKNLPAAADFAKAFSPTPFIRNWGCLATTVFLNVIIKARLAKNDTASLGIPEDDRTLWFNPKIIFPDTRPGAIDLIKKSFFKANYMAFLAKAVNKPVEGGAPGMGALFTKRNSIGFRLFVARDDVKAKDPKTQKEVTIRGFKREMEFLEKELGAVFSADGYMRYDP